MRLWHYKLIEYLPNSQLIAQWRELNSIFKNKNKHILINYIYNYPIEYLLNYTIKVVEEMNKRNFNIKKTTNFNNYFSSGINMFIVSKCKFKEHNDEYLKICYYNLKEKYLRGQKDFTKDIWNKLENFYNKEIKNDRSN